MQAVKQFLKREIVLVISLFLAIVSVFFVPPSREYLSYIDFRTLSLLFCLMAIVAGLSAMGLFRKVASFLLSRCKTVRMLTLTVVMLCFFFSMAITNDVALIAFIPLTVTALKLSGNTKFLIPVVVLQTVAANLGSMLTPVGNPQNLYLYGKYAMTARSFFLAVFPYALLSCVLLIVSCLFFPGALVQTVPDPEREGEEEDKEKKPSVAGACIYAGLFLLALLSVFRVLPYYITLGITAGFLLIADRKIFLKIDYSLLLTFLFLFVFIGNLGNISAVESFLRTVVNGREVLAGIVSSQIFSNVPAAILLSGFTENGYALLTGVNLGGLGTLIASMASLISFRFAAKEQINIAKYMLSFTAVNIIFLGLNLVLWLILL